MATVNFLYRSTKPKANLNLRLLFRHDDKDFQIGGKSKIEISKKDWQSIRKSRISDIDVKNLKTEIEDKTNDLETFILKELDRANLEGVDKNWLKETIQAYYNPVKENKIPDDLIGFIKWYLEHKSNEISQGKHKRLTTTLNRMDRLEKATGRKIYINEIDENFKSRFIDFFDAEKYAHNTKQKELGRIKTICNYAKYLGLETHYQLDKLHIKPKTVNHVYLNFDELEVIKNKTFEADYLDNARDWLLISCYTGQRVSDFMKFTKDTIRAENDKQLLEFRQQKTNKLMTIPLSKEVKTILTKRNGNFPRPLSAQKYNKYIKKVCRQCGFDEPTEGKKRVCIAPEGVTPDYHHYRDERDTYPKYELITSHVGRRSFATNFYGKVPTPYLIGITGHSDESTFLNYIKKSNKDLALDAYDYFN